jgi:hypothetical protein
VSYYISFFQVYFYYISFFQVRFYFTPFYDMPYHDMSFYDDWGGCSGAPLLPQRALSKEQM